MRRVLVAVGALLISQSAFAESYIVKYKENKSFRSLETLGAKILETHAPGQILLIDASKDQAEAVRKDANVEYVVPNATVRTLGLQPQWALAKVKASEAWERSSNRGNKDVIVAVIDTGVSSTHESLAVNMVPGYDFRDNDNDPTDITSAQNPGHGTHCAGIVGAVGTVDGGTSGMSADVAIMPIRFLGADGSGELMGAIKSIDYAIEHKANVISASWGATIRRADAQPLVDAVERADKAGIIFVSAAANDGKNNDTTEVYPANAGFPNTITVAASSENDSKPTWSNYGKATVHLASPGDKILSTLPGNKYGVLSGTSMATPLVSGLVAFLLAQDKTLTGAEIRALLQKTGAAVNIETACNCRVDAFAAVAVLMDKAKWLVPSAATLAVGATEKVALKNADGYVAFSSSEAAVATVNNEGLVTAVAPGSTVIKATDQSGKSVDSLEFRVLGSTPPPDAPAGECPIGDPALCGILCGINPELPWCN